MAKPAAATPAIAVLLRAGMAHTLHSYDHDATAHARGLPYGLEAAAALGKDQAQVFKTLLAEVDGVLTVAVLPVALQLDLKALAGAVGRTGLVRSGAPAGIESLSHREHQVFRLLISGRTVSEIGAQLRLAPNTVSTYRARILEKTGARNDVELALLAERQGPAAGL